MEILVVAGSLLWVALLLVPWRPWSTRECLEPVNEQAERNLCDVTVLIPARNESAVIKRTLLALGNQSDGLQVILVDDQSSDETASLAVSTLAAGLLVLKGKPLPSGWTGKLWALEQGWRNTRTELILLLDADIELDPRMIGALKQKLIGEKLDLVSIMARLRMETFWEKLLAPAFIYFFKLLYPFSLGNNPSSALGVAAGGCILVRSDALRKTGAFPSIRDAIIDDCALAASVKKSGGRTWTGLSLSVRSHRPYPHLSNFWEMVERTAFTQLRYSIWLLLATTSRDGTRLLVSVVGPALFVAGGQMFRRRRILRYDFDLPAHPALLSESDSVGSDASFRRWVVSSDDMVVRAELLAW